LARLGTHRYRLQVFSLPDGRSETFGSETLLRQLQHTQIQIGEDAMSLRRWVTASENVQRVLSGLKPAATFWCRLRYHHWSRWAVYRRDFDPYGKERVFQHRECIHCGLNQSIKKKV